MKEFWLQIGGLLLAIVVALFLTFSSNSPLGGLNPSVQVGDNTSSSGSGSGGGTEELQIGETLITVDIADTQALRSQGLGGRSSLGTDQGMLFIFSSPEIPKFWMKDMQFPIDIIWINNGSVVDITPDVPAPAEGESDSQLQLYSPQVEVNEVLEVNAGFVISHNISVGDKVEVVQQ